MKEECVVCYNLIEDEPCLPCDHWVHRACVLQWRQDLETMCPICRRPVSLKIVDSSDYDLVVSTNPNEFTNWVIPQKLLCGGYPMRNDLPQRPNFLDLLLENGVNVFVNLCEEHEIQKYGDYSELVRIESGEVTLISLPTPDRGVTFDTDVSKVVNQIVQHITRGDVVYVHCWGGHGRSGVICACVLMQLERISSEKALQQIKTCHNTRGYNSKRKSPHGVKQHAQVRRFSPPWNVIVCGDRHSFTSFRKLMEFELSQLPPYSTVIHGGCKGIDALAGWVAKKNPRLSETKVYRADWNSYGTAAGPIRNRCMLDNNYVDLVLAFHPDIRHSKGTRDMISEALRRKIRVILHDLKRSEEITSISDLDQ